MKYRVTETKGDLYTIESKRYFGKWKQVEFEDSFGMKQIVLHSDKSVVEQMVSDLSKQGFIHRKYPMDSFR